MFSFGNMKVGARLGLGFGCVLALLTLMAGIGIWRLQNVGTMTNALVTSDLKKAQLAKEETNIIEVNTVRTIAAIKATEPETEKFFLNEIAKLSEHAGKVLQRLKESISDPAAQSLFDDMIQKRTIYQAARAAAFKEKAAGNMAVTNKFLNEEMKPKLEAFQQSVKKLDDFHSQRVDALAKDVEQQYQNGRMLLIVLTVVALLIGVGFSLWVTRSITRPMIEALSIARTVAAGDLTSEIEVTSTDETGQLLQALKDMNESLKKIVGEVRIGTEAIGSGTKQIASGNADLSQRTEEQASSLEETASSMEELTSTVKQNAENAKQANQLAASASEVAVKGGTVVGQVVTTMSSINESSKKIVDIIGVIDGIAFQTNILALNAAVEAARAGEQGRGFAVVASEVRNLAQRSAAAAKEIKQLIGDSVDKVGAGTKLVDEAGKTMQEIVTSVKRVTDIMSEITAASQEQSSGIEQVNQAITQMDEVTQQNSALVEEAAAAAESLEEQAQNLTQAVSVFKLAQGGERTLAAVKAEKPVASVTHLPARDKAAARGPAAVERKPVAPKMRKIANAKQGDGDWTEF